MILVANSETLLLTFLHVSGPFLCTKVTTLCLTLRTTVTSEARVPQEDACYRVRNLFVFSRIQKRESRDQWINGRRAW